MADLAPSWRSASGSSVSGSRAMLTDRASSSHRGEALRSRTSTPTASASPAAIGQSRERRRVLSVVRATGIHSAGCRDHALSRTG